MAEIQCRDGQRPDFISIQPSPETGYDIVVSIPLGPLLPRGNLSFAGGMKIHFEDATLMVIEKPANLLSIASEAEQEKTAYFQLTEYLREQNKNATERVWIVHRLDRETSGLMVFRKQTAEAKGVCCSRIGESYEKRYQVCYRREACPPTAGNIRFPCPGWKPAPVEVFSIPQQGRMRGGRSRALPGAEKRQRKKPGVELTLETGRRHQIRVHLTDAGCPIVGDVKYSRQKTDPAKARLEAALLFPTFRSSGNAKGELRLPVTAPAGTCPSGVTGIGPDGNSVTIEAYRSGKEQKCEE